jgi:hypothetical protein
MTIRGMKRDFNTYWRKKTVPNYEYDKRWEFYNHLINITL